MKTTCIFLPAAKFQWPKPHKLKMDFRRTMSDMGKSKCLGHLVSRHKKKKVKADNTTSFETNTLKSVQ